MQRLLIPVLSLLIAGLAIAANAAAAPGPKILRASLGDRGIAGVPALLEVHVRDPLATINGLQVDFGDGASTAISACRPPALPGVLTPPAFAPGHPARHALPHTYAKAGTYTVRLAVTSGDCGERGPIVASKVIRTTVIGAKVSGKAAPVLARSAQVACTHPTALPEAAGVVAVRRSVACLVNAIRRQAGLPVLRHHPRLALAAGRHARDMVARGYFAHRSPGGADLVDRLRRARFPRTGPTGENLAAGTGGFGTPVGALLAWLESPPHRANLLERDFTRAGYGVAPAMPGRADGAGATYVLTLSG